MASRWEPDRLNLRRIPEQLAEDEVRRVATLTEVMGRVALIAHAEYATGYSVATMHITGPEHVGPTHIKMTVGSNGIGAWFLQSGARRHRIRKGRYRKGQKPLSFYWKKMGRRVAFVRVNHPGMKRDPWLTDSLKTAAKIRRFKVTVGRVSDMRKV